MMRALLALGAFVAACLAFAQNAPGDEPRKAEPGAVASVDAKARDAAREPSRAGDDPRVCLEFASNLEVHRCAEKYRPRAQRGRPD